MTKLLMTILLINLSVMSVFAYNLDIETGIISSGYNDVQIPGDTGTRFSLSNDLSVDSKIFYRVRLTKEIKNNKFISFLYAPLLLDAEGILGKQVNFNGDVFPVNTNVQGKYRFDSYRISYWKKYVKNDRFSYKLGFTAEIRDASVKISGNGINSEKKNTGFVPLLNFGFNYKFSNKFSFIFDADALAGGPGRAEDVLIAGKYKISPQSNVKIGYRLVEGGADVTEVYNFALLNYVVLGFTYSF